MLQAYAGEIETQMKFVFDELSEKDRRLYAAVEALKLPRGGQAYLATVFACNRKTIRRGQTELAEPERLPARPRVRQPGGGRKRLLATHPELPAQVREVLAEHTAGDPMNADIRWTYLTPTQISEALTTTELEISPYVAKQLLADQDYVKRTLRKSFPTGTHADRDAQFQIIQTFRHGYAALGNPILSIDAKKKEVLGHLYRRGALYTTAPLQVYDHDFSHLAQGVVIPYTLYDVLQNRAYVYLGTSHDTGEFVGDCLWHWWWRYGRRHYPGATSILALADGGGSNSCRHYLYKEALQHTADKIGREIRMAHYPPYCSKWNPVEHRVFPHLTRAMQGVVLTSYALVKTLLDAATTKTGLQVVTHLVTKVYETGKKVAEDFKATMRIVADQTLGQWNYCAIPATT
jgi:hypothetical protein